MLKHHLLKCVDLHLAPAPTTDHLSLDLWPYCCGIQWNAFQKHTFRKELNSDSAVNLCSGSCSCPSEQKLKLLRERSSFSSLCSWGKDIDQSSSKEQDDWIASSMTQEIEAHHVSNGLVLEYVYIHSKHGDTQLSQQQAVTAQTNLKYNQTIQFFSAHLTLYIQIWITASFSWGWNMFSIFAWKCVFVAILGVQRMLVQPDSDILFWSCQGQSYIPYITFATGL